MESLRKQFNTSTLVLVPIAIAINIAVGTIVQRLGLPLYIDSIGTVLVGAVAGPWAGALTGFLGSIVWAISGLNAEAFFWAVVAAVIGFLAGVFGRRGWLKSPWKAGLAGVITGVVAAGVSAPIAAYGLEGVTGNLGTDAMVAAFRAAGMDMLGANLSQGFASDPLDKLFTFVIVWAVLLGLPERVKTRFSGE